jgi:hypothetical protein
VRRFAEKTARGETPYDITPLLAALEPASRRPWREQVLAAQLLSELPLSELERQRAAAVLGAIVGETGPRSNRKRRNRHWLERTATLSLMITAGLLASSLHTLSLWPEDTDLLVQTWGCWTLFTILLSPLVWPVSEILEDLHFCRVRAAGIRALARLQSAELAGSSVRALLHTLGMRLSAGSGWVRKAAAETLPEMLAHLTPEYYGQLDPKLAPAMCRALEYGDETLTLALLQALERVGDGRAVRSVEALAGEGFLASWHTTPAVRTEAHRVLPILIARREQENAAKLLLRASEPGASTPYLLRPAQERSEMDSQVLLRSGSGPSF